MRIPCRPGPGRSDPGPCQRRNQICYYQPGRARTGERPGMIRRPRHGKIARLPNAVRNLLNQKLRDNVAASKIAAWLQAEHGPAVKEAGLGRSIRRNISAWRQGGYADWERQQERLEEMRAQQEFAFQLACKTDGSLQAANLAIAASQIYEALQDFDVGELTVRLKEKPELYPAL